MSPWFVNQRRHIVPKGLQDDPVARYDEATKDIYKGIQILMGPWEQPKRWSPKQSAVDRQVYRKTEQLQTMIMIMWYVIMIMWYVIMIWYWAKTAELIGGPGAYKYKYNNYK